MRSRRKPVSMRFVNKTQKAGQPKYLEAIKVSSAAV